MSEELKENPAAYYDPYIANCKLDHVVDELESSLDEAVELLKSLSNSESEYAYAEGKWTIKEILVHIIDTERIFAYRALRAARNDSSNLTMFDHEEYVQESNANQRALIDIVFEYMTVRNATISMYKSLDSQAMSRKAYWAEMIVSVENIAKIISGHGRHHISVIKEKYIS